MSELDNTILDILEDLSNQVLAVCKEILIINAKVGALEKKIK
jgi:hypothetical protein